MEAEVTFQSKTPSLVLSFIPCRRRASEARPSAKQNPGDNLKKFWRMKTNSSSSAWTVAMYTTI